MANVLITIANNPTHNWNQTTFIDSLWLCHCFVKIFRKCIMYYVNVAMVRLCVSIEKCMFYVLTNFNNTKLWKKWFRCALSKCDAFVATSHEFVFFFLFWQRNNWHCRGHIVGEYWVTTVISCAAHVVFIIHAIQPIQVRNIYLSLFTAFYRP